MAKHKHEKTLIHPTTGEAVCWCKWPYCIEIGRLKRELRDVALIAIYELIQYEKKIDRRIPLDYFVKVIE